MKKLDALRRRAARISHAVFHTIKTVYALRTSDNYILYFGIPMHANIGDLAQCVCIRRFLKENFSEKKIIEIDTIVFMNPKSRMRKIIKKYVSPNAFIFFQSGYCTHDLGGMEDLMHQAVIKDYPDNKLIFFPQTVFFKRPERAQQASAIYGSHKHLLFLSRDAVSYEIAKSLFPQVKHLLYPDIVTTLIGSKEASHHREGILLCVRNDSERFYSNEEIEGLFRRLKAMDSVEVNDTTIHKAVTAQTIALDKFVDCFIDAFGKYRLVITDRYHGTIFSLIANTPVLVIKTTDHKVRTGVDWFNGVYDSSAIYVDDIHEVPQYAERILNQPIIKNAPYFQQEYYDKLKSIIMEL